MPDSDIQRLVERIEAATGPDRELDALISVATSPHDDSRIVYAKGKRWYRSPGKDRIPFHVGGGNGGTSFGIIYQQLRHTASIDAAVLLVPGGWEWAYLDKRAIVRIPGRLKHEIGDGATPALALCAAALRVRITERTDDE